MSPFELWLFALVSGQYKPPLSSVLDVCARRLVYTLGTLNVFTSYVAVIDITNVLTTPLTGGNYIATQASSTQLDTLVSSTWNGLPTSIFLSP